MQENADQNNSEYGDFLTQCLFDGLKRQTVSVHKIWLKTKHILNCQKNVSHLVNLKILLIYFQYVFLDSRFSFTNKRDVIALFMVFFISVILVILAFSARSIGEEFRKALTFHFDKIFENCKTFVFYICQKITNMQGISLNWDPATFVENAWKRTKTVFLQSRVIYF